VGLEAYYNGYRRKTIDGLVSLAAKHGLITSGGSDFHGLGGDNEAPLGGIDVPFHCAERLIAMAERHSQKVIR